MRLKHDAHGVFLPMYFCFMAVLLVKYKGCMPQKYCKCSTLPVELERVISVFQLILPECMKLLPLYTNCILKNDILLGGECNDVRYLFSNLLIHSQIFFNMAEYIAITLQRSQSSMKITIVFIPSSSGTFTNNWMKTFYMLCVMKKTRLLLRLPVVPSKYIFFPPCLLSFAWEKTGCFLRGQMLSVKSGSLFNSLCCIVKFFKNSLAFFFITKRKQHFSRGKLYCLQISHIGSIFYKGFQDQIFLQFC